jgi:hypothetical protein
MKKLRFVLVVAVALVMVFCAVSAFAQEIITRDVTVEGDNVRGPLVTELVSSYFADTQATYVHRPLGEYVIVTGPGGSQKIQFSRELVARLEKNPQAGLMNICPRQAEQLKEAVGPLQEQAAEQESVSHNTVIVNVLSDIAGALAFVAGDGCYGEYGSWRSRGNGNRWQNQRSRGNGNRWQNQRSRGNGNRYQNQRSRGNGNRWQNQRQDHRCDDRHNRW